MPTELGGVVLEAERGKAEYVNFNVGLVVLAQMSGGGIVEAAEDKKTREFISRLVGKDFYLDVEETSPIRIGSVAIVKYEPEFDPMDGNKLYSFLPPKISSPHVLNTPIGNELLNEFLEAQVRKSQEGYNKQGDLLRELLRHAEPNLFLLAPFPDMQPDSYSDYSDLAQTAIRNLASNYRERFLIGGHGKARVIAGNLESIARNLMPYHLNGYVRT